MIPTSNLLLVHARQQPMHCEITMTIPASLRPVVHACIDIAADASCNGRCGIATATERDIFA